MSHVTLTTPGGKPGRWSDSLHFTDEETEAPRVSDLLKDTMSKESGLPTDDFKFHVLLLLSLPWWPPPVRRSWVQQ